MFCAELNRIIKDCRPPVLMLTGQSGCRPLMARLGVDYALEYDKRAERRCKANQLAAVVLAANRIVDNGWGDELAVA